MSVVNDSGCLTWAASRRPWLAVAIGLGLVIGTTFYLNRGQRRIAKLHSPLALCHVTSLVNWTVT